MTCQSANGMKISNKYLRLTSREGLHLNQKNKKNRYKERVGRKKERRRKTKEEGAEKKERSKFKRDLGPVR